MQMRRGARWFIGLAVCGATGACAPRHDARPAADALPAAVALYRTMEIDSAAVAFRRITEADPNNLDAKAWLADAVRRQGDLERAAAMAREVLARDPRHGFAHVVLGACFDPVMGGMTGASRDSALAHYHMATQASAPEGDGWLLRWKFAAAQGDTALERELLANVERIGYLTPAAIAWGRALLEGLPPGAVLLTNGDMDTYPTRVAQLVHGVRADVAVVNLSLLNLPDYARTVARVHGLPLPAGVADAGLQGVPDLSATITQSWKQAARKGRLTRPYFAAVTVADPTLVDLADPAAVFTGPHVRVAGPAGAAAEDRERARAWLAAFDPTTFAGRFISEKDRSPVRQATGDRLGFNFVPVLNWLAGRAMAEHDTATANLALRRMEALRASVVLGDSIEPYVVALRKRVAAATPGR